MASVQLKRYVRGFCRNLGLDVRSLKHVRELIDFVEDRQIDTVLDVGANVGQFGSAIRAKGFKGRIISFEPISSEFQTLSALAAADGNWETHHCALGAAPGEATINVSSYSVFSSILPETQAATQFDQRAGVTRTETIQVRTLDEMAGDWSGNILLKVDTQGYERNVLEGGRELLRRVKGVHMELPIVQLYQGNWQFHEAVTYMANAGFLPAQIQPVNYSSTDRVSLLEVDCLFRPRTASDVS